MATLNDQTTHLSQLMGQKLGVGGKGLSARTRRAGRALPAKVRRAADALSEAEAAAGHPKLAQQADPAALDQAYRTATEWLEPIDRPAKRRAAVMDWIAGTAFNFLLIGLAVLAVLLWRGLL